MSDTKNKNTKKDENIEDTEKVEIPVNEEDENLNEKIDEELENEGKDIGDTDNELDSLKDNFMRLQADFINYKRRTEQERKDYIELGSKKVLLDLLNIIDNFERAIEAQTEDEKFKDGIKLIYKQLLDLLERNNVKEMETLNEKFDPNLHHAVLVEELDDVDEGIVLDVLQKGYLVGEKVLRPAMVKVSK